MRDVPMRNSGIRGSMDSVWIWASVGAAFFQALRYAGLKVLNQRLSTQVTTYVRVLFTLPILIVYLLAVLWWTGEPLPALSRGLLIYSAIAAITQFVGTVLVVRLFQLGNFAIATLIIKADVIMTALLGTAFFSEAITPIGWVAIIVTMLGVIVISSGRSPAPASTSPADGVPAASRGTGAAAAPALLGLSAALVYALSYLCLREGILAIDPAAGTLVRAAYAVLVMAGLSALMVGVYLAAREPRELLRMFSFQRLCWFIGMTSGIGSIAWFIAAALTNASYVAAVAQVQIVFTLLLSYFYFGERIRGLEVGGIAIIVAGLALFRMA
jgi:drug/metabolite transporter (DMT)-like permease